VFLPIFAAILSGIAYAIYLPLVYDGGSVPNPASWTVWAFLATLNAISFWKSSQSKLATAQFFTGSVGCLAVWIFALAKGKFTPLDPMAWIILGLCLAACLVWWITREATYASIIVGITLTISFIPTISGVWRNGHLENTLPWYLWTAGFILTTIYVARKKEGRNKPGWRLLFVVPVVCVVCHSIVAFLAN
jgi:hypothetical protein